MNARYWTNKKNKTMRKLTVLMHVTLDGYVASEDGDMDFIKFDDELFSDVGKKTATADAAIYGRVTYDMMEGHWPTAGSQPNASEHSKQHSAWYNKVTKYVVSRSQPKTGDRAEVIGKNLSEEVRKIKSQPGKDILVIGSPSIARALTEAGLVDEFYLTLNPVILGKGISMYPTMNDRANLQLTNSKTYKCGVIALTYKRAD